METASRIAAAFGVLSCVLAHSSPGRTTPPATQPSSQPTTWGESKAGLQTSLAMEGDPAVGGKLVFHLAMRNVGTEPVKLGQASELACWLAVAQGSGDARKMLYSEKVLPARDLADWPMELKAGKVIQFRPIDLSASSAFSSESARELLTSYISGKAPDNPPKSVGKLSEVFSPGKAVARMTLYVPRPGEKAVVVNSNALDLSFAPPRLSALSAEARKALVGDLLKKFDRDAFGGMAAHGTAVRLGKEIVPDLVKAVAEKSRPDYSRMWIATAIADIPDAKSAAALVDLLEDPLGGVRQVVAYHGPKQRNEKLDKAIIEKAKTLKEDGFTAMALLGFMVFRNSVPQELVKAGLDSDDPKARATAAKALTGLASDYNVSRLRELARDPDPRVRETARKVLEAISPASQPSKDR
jgi:hypothetical protein